MTVGKYCVTLGGSGGHYTPHKFLEVSKGMKLLGTISSFPAAYDLLIVLNLHHQMHNKQ